MFPKHVLVHLMGHRCPTFLLALKLLDKKLPIKKPSANWASSLRKIQNVY